MSSVTNKAEAIDTQVAEDINILNRSLYGEYFGIAAYQVAIESGLLEDGVRQVARQFQRDHEQHADSLIEKIQECGGVPDGRKTWEEMAAEFPPPALENQEDILRYAASLESSGASAEVMAVSRLNSPELRKLVASIAGVEAMHWAVLRNALGENPVPVAFVADASCSEYAFSFG